MLSWAEDPAARRAEFLRVTTDQIPDESEIYRLMDSASPWIEISVPRKGDDAGSLKVSADTLFMTKAYLAERAELVKRFQEKDASYVEPKEVFLSLKTGLALTPDSITALYKSMFMRAGLKNANVHRLRAKAAQDCVESALDAFLERGIQIAPGSGLVETVLQQASILLGHTHPSSLQHYLNKALGRRIRLAKESMQQAKDRASRNVDTLLKRVLDDLKACQRMRAELMAIIEKGQLAKARIQIINDATVA